MKLPDNVALYLLRSKEFSKEEIDALKTSGTLAENWFAVTYSTDEKSKTPVAMFGDREIAERYRDEFHKTAIVDPWPMIIKKMDQS
jgi:hypothetical protein